MNDKITPQSLAAALAPVAVPSTPDAVVRALGNYTVNARGQAVLSDETRRIAAALVNEPGYRQVVTLLSDQILSQAPDNVNGWAPQLNRPIGGTGYEAEDASVSNLELQAALIGAARYTATHPGTALKDVPLAAIVGEMDAPLKALRDCGCTLPRRR